MKTTELRIGNLVSDIHASDTFSAKVNKITSDRVYYGLFHSHPNDLKPIEITEQMLLRLGFKQSKGKWGNDFHILEKDGFICMFTIEHWTDTQEDSKFKNHWHCKYQLNGNKLKYIHEVQNLFFSLCGEELVFF